MMSRLDERVAYGRTIRERAGHLLEVHGPDASAVARRSADEPGIPDAERSFRTAVAERVARASAAVSIDA